MSDETNAEVNSAKNPSSLSEYLKGETKRLTLVSWVDLPEWGNTSGDDHYAALLHDEAADVYLEGTVVVASKIETRDRVPVDVAPRDGTHIPTMTIVA